MIIKTQSRRSRRVRVGQWVSKTAEELCFLLFVLLIGAVVVFLLAGLVAAVADGSIARGATWASHNVATPMIVGALLGIICLEGAATDELALRRALVAVGAMVFGVAAIIILAVGVPVLGAPAILQVPLVYGFAMMLVGLVAYANADAQRRA